MREGQEITAFRTSSKAFCSVCVHTHGTLPVKRESGAMRKAYPSMKFLEPTNKPRTRRKLVGRDMSLRGATLSSVNA